MKVVLSALAGALGLITATSAMAGILAPRKASQTVNVILVNGTPGTTICSSGPGAYQVLPDGKEQAFTIPTGKVFVLTSVVTELGPSAPNSGVLVTLQIGDTSPLTLAAQQGVNLGGGLGLGSATFSFPSGYPTSKGFCISVLPSVDFDATLSGFFASNR